MRNRTRKFNGFTIYFYYEKSSGIMEVYAIDTINDDSVLHGHRVGYHGMVEYYKDNNNFKRRKENELRRN